MGDSYRDFLAGKARSFAPAGLSGLPEIHPSLFPFQRAIVERHLRLGRGAIFAGTGLGKTLMQLSWADAVERSTGGQILALTPLAVAHQTVAEAERFGIAGVSYAKSGDDAGSRIVVTNYDRMERFDPSRFAGVILDESSILKTHDSRTRIGLTDSFAGHRFKLACTATPAPNDWTELGNHSEFLGVMSEKEMLATFFVHDGAVRAGESGADGWRLKRHARRDFWGWVASWATMIRHPREIGFEQDGYDLPPLVKRQVTVPVEYRPSVETGLLFPVEAKTLGERLGAKRDSIEARVRAAYETVAANLFCDKLAACGSQNTQSADARNTNPMQPSASGEGPPAGRQKKTQNTCASTASVTLRSSSAPGNSRTRSTRQSASDIGETPNMQSAAGRPLGCGLVTKSEMSASALSSGLALTNMTPSSLLKGVDAQSAAFSRPTLPVTDCTLTTVILPERSEASSAAHATLASESSETTRTCSTEPLNICSKPGLRPWIVWCQLNSEQDALEKAFGDLAFSIRGADSNDAKLDRHERWLKGERPVLITKMQIFGFGMNWQHCRDMVFVGLNDSFEQLFQAIRRCWRFGQTQPVMVHFIASELEGAVVANLDAKERDYEAMAEAMAAEMRDLIVLELTGRWRKAPVLATKPMELPAWM